MLDLDKKTKEILLTKRKLMQTEINYEINNRNISFVTWNTIFFKEEEEVVEHQS